MSTRTPPTLPKPDPTTGLAPLLSQEQTAQVLGISVRSLFTLATSGQIKSVKILSRRLFTPREVQAFIDRTECAEGGK